MTSGSIRPAPGIVSEAHALIDTARGAFARDSRPRALLAGCAHRLEQPLRVALAGSIKAGKSTLLNALVGQDIAPTDATECTRVVTWYRNGATPSVTACAPDGARAHVVVRRAGGAHGLTFDLERLRWPDGHPREVGHLEVEWPAAALADTTIIDTPGTSSLSREVSRRTARLLTPDDGTEGETAGAVPGADAVVYLLRRLDDADVRFLERVGTATAGGTVGTATAGGTIGAATAGGTVGTATAGGTVGTHVTPAAGGAGPLGVIGVVSRADEIGAGSLDALHSARDVAARFAGELERTGLCQAVIPVAGLLAFAAATLRQQEFAAFQALAGIPVEELTVALLSADRFARPDLPLPVPPELRFQLAERFGLFGIRMAVTLIRLGVRDSATLAAELTARSGVDELRGVLDVQFGQRADQLKAHSALTALDRVLRAYPGTAADRLLPRVRTLLADVHGFAELRLLGRLRTDELPLPAADLAELHRLVGGSGIAPHLRLGLPPDAPAPVLRAAAVDAVRKWRARAAHPLADQATSAACQTAARSAEGTLGLLP